MQLANQGNVERAIALLLEHVNKNASDVQAQVVLGRILDFDGRPDEAVTLWERGLSGACRPTFRCLMSIGEIRHRQGRRADDQLPSRNGRGQRSKDEAAEAAFKRSHLAQAAAAYEKTRKLQPDDQDAAAALASTYSLQQNHDAAVGVWRSLVEREPGNAGYHLSLALATRDAGRARHRSEIAGRGDQAEPAARRKPHQGACRLPQSERACRRSRARRKPGEVLRSTAFVLYDRLLG